MKIEEIRAMSDEDLEIKICTDVLGWQIYNRLESIGEIDLKVVESRFEDGREIRVHQSIPRFCLDLNEIRMVEKIVVEKDARAYESALAEVIGFDLQRPITPKIYLITASARQKSEACLLALSENLDIWEGEK